MLDDQGSGFSGTITDADFGTVELAGTDAIGTARVGFTITTNGQTQTLQIDAADAPAAGGTFANRIVNFWDVGSTIDLRSVAFVSGATVVLNGSTLTLTNDGRTYKFTLVGPFFGSAFAASGDGHGGTDIKVTVRGALPSNGEGVATARPLGAEVNDAKQAPAPSAPTRFAEAMAGFSGDRGSADFAVHAGGTVLTTAPLLTAATSGR